MPAPTPLGPGVEEHSGDGGPSSASSDGDATHEGQREVTHSSSGPWTDVEWEEWRARRRSRYSWSPTTTTPSGGNGSVSANCEDDRIGGSDKISAPEFSGEDDGDGMATRGYLRKVAAWRRMTRLRPNKQALALYNNLTGRAWRDAEELDLALLDSEHGVDVFTQWVSEKYLDKEVVKVGKCMLEFFKYLKKGHGQEIRDFNQEYDRQVSRLKEVGCNLPDLCLAWFYVDKLRLENDAELNLLSSTGNRYELSKLQDAAVVQDRMNRRLWEPRKHGEKDRKKPQNKAPVQSAQVLHVCEAFHVGSLETSEIVAITDCACSRSVAGSEWIKRLRQNALAKGHQFEVVQQHEHFKFGGDKLFLSKRAWCFWLNVHGKWFILKVSELDTDVPLLLSRPVLAQLGMRYDLPANTASFEALSLFDVPLQTTLTGLPAVPVACGSGPAPRWPKSIQWDLVEIYVPSESVAYMVRHEGDVVEVPKKLFYPKKLDPLVLNKLSAEHLCPEWFRGWWRDNEVLGDFWIEGDLYMDRIHVTPRRDLFDPRDWQTSDDDLKECLLLSLGDTRTSTCILCTHTGKPFVMSHAWRFEAKVKGQSLWIGRSRFQRPQVAEVLQSVSPGAPNPGDVPPSLGMEDAACRASGCLDRHEGEVRAEHVSAGVEVTVDGDPGASKEDQFGSDQMHPGTTEGEVLGGGAGDTTKGNAGSSDEDAAGSYGNYGGTLAKLWRQVFGERPHVREGGDPQAAGTHKDPAHNQDGRGGNKDRRAKGRKFRESVKVAIAAKREKRDKRDQGDASPVSSDYETENEKVSKYEAGGVPHNEDVYNTATDETYEDVYNVVTDETYGHDKNLEPKVKFVYGDDYEAVRNLPKRRVRRNTKKKVKSWAAKAVTALATLVAVCATPLQTFASNLVTAAEDRVDFLELLAGSAHLTETFAQQGFNVLEPRDIKLGHDLSKSEVQEEVINDIMHHRPKLLWIALPCTKWSPWQRLNYHGRKQALRRERAAQRKLIRFSKRVAQIQMAHGGEVVFEHPFMSDMWDDGSFAEIFHDPRMFRVNLDMCRYNLRAVTDDGLLRKPTTLICSHGVFHRDLGRRCQGDHVHTPTAGRNTRAAGVYTYEFCRAVVECYKSEIVPRCWTSFPVIGDGELSDGYEPGTPLQGSDIYMDGSDVDMEQHTLHDTVHEGDPHAPHGESVGDENTPVESATRASLTGITFPPHVGKHTAQILRRLHQNLGHPRHEDLARHLRLAGAGDDVVKAAHQLKCATCQRHANPGTRRPARTIVARDFNQEVGVDTFVLYTPSKRKLNVLSILDIASGYHVVKLLKGRTSNNISEAFLDAWVSWAGSPHRVVADQERGLMKEFTDCMEQHGIKVEYVAGQAHWKNGPVERQNSWYRMIWQKTIDHMAITDDEAEWTLAQVCQAKNSLRRKHGYSPAQWVFGAQPRSGNGMIDEDPELMIKDELLTPGQERHRHEEIRQAAREAFIKSQADSAVRRALQGRPRTVKNNFEPGDWVYLYRKSKNAGGAARLKPEAGEWIGPGTIVGVEGDSFWVSRGGRCLLCAREHLRHAESEELGMLMQAKVMQEDLLQLVHHLDEDDENEDLFADAQDDIRVDDLDTLVPQKRARGKQYVPMVKSQAPHASHVTYAIEENDEADFQLPKAYQKQLDKEVKWSDIPEPEKPLYTAAEEKQWKEHLQYGAVRVLNMEESNAVRSTISKDRILPSRFAYRDKNVAKRREDPSIAPKAKARLCIGGHRDPDLKDGSLQTEAPTATKLSFMTLLFLAGQFGWRLSAGDVQAAFLNGHEARRNLYFSQPPRGLPGVEPGALIEVIKGVFGLATSPRLWWEKLSTDLKKLDLCIDGKHLHLVSHELDACYFLLRDQQGDLHGALITHVDDLLIAASPQVLDSLKQQLSGIFPIADWEENDFEYVGSNIKQDDNGIQLSQKSYVNSRLETVEIPKHIILDDSADMVAKIDNQSTIGALSWLASQSRPDLQAGVSLAQRKQKQPCYGDVRETNKVVKMAQNGKGEPLTFSKLGSTLDDLVILVYHDAAWANAVASADDQEFVPGGHGIYSQLGHLVLMCDRRALKGDEVNPAVIAWKSHACPRVCRSTFAAETMASLEGWEDAIAFRAMLAGSLRGEPLSEDAVRGVVPIISLTDCKSLFDSVHRIGGPKAPSEKRLMIDLAALRQLINAEAACWGHAFEDPRMMRWVPTQFQLADILTKLKTDVQTWWDMLRNLKLPFSVSR